MVGNKSTTMTIIVMPQTVLKLQLTVVRIVVEFVSKEKYIQIAPMPLIMPDTTEIIELIQYIKIDCKSV